MSEPHEFVSVTSHSFGIAFGRTISGKDDQSTAEDPPTPDEFAKHFAEAMKAENGDYLLLFARVPTHEVSLTTNGVQWRGQEFRLWKGGAREELSEHAKCESNSQLQGESRALQASQSSHRSEET